MLPFQELERLEVERVEMIRQHLCQYTQLRHETDMFNQSVSLLLILKEYFKRLTYASKIVVLKVVGHGPPGKSEAGIHPALGSDPAPMVAMALQ